MKPKKMIALVLAILLLFTITPTAFSVNNEETTESLYVYSKKCPEEFETFAQEMIGYLLWDYNIPHPFLGEAFTFSNQDSNIYYFPVFSEGEVVLTFRVYSGQNGKPTGIVSPAFADDLNEVAKMTSVSNPLRIISENKGDYATVVFHMDDYEQEVQITPNIKETRDFPEISFRTEFEVINCGQIEQIQLHPSTRTSKTLPVSITETQGKNNWCFAYCTAMLLRYNGIKSTAESVMKENYGEGVSTKTGLEKYDFLDYMHSKYFNSKMRSVYPSVNETYTAIVSEINDNCPVILNMQEKDPATGEKISFTHALLVRGYEDIKASTSVWNPWYSYFETVIDLNNYTPAQSTARRFYIGDYFYDNYKYI